MSGIYASDGGINITLVSKTDSPVGVYAYDGSIRVCTDSTKQGVYAENGSLRINSSTTTAYDATGALGGSLIGSVFYPATSGTGGGFSLDAFMAAQSDGLYFDFTKTDRHFQENTGPTLANDVGEAIGLALDQRTWGGKTLAQVLAAQAELRGTGATALAGSATVATYNTSTGAGTATRIDASNQSSVTFAVTANKTYAVDIQAGAKNIYVRSSTVAGTILATVLAGVRSMVYVSPTAAVMLIVATAAETVDFTVHSIKLLPGNHGIQTTGTCKPLRQSTGAKYDGSDDNHLTPYLAQAGANSIVALVTVPASLAAVQVVAGLSAAAGTNGFYLAIDTTGKMYAAGAGAAFSVRDLRGTTLVLAISVDGTTLKLFADATQEISVAQTVFPTTAVPMALAANNNNGAGGASFFGGSIKKLVALRQSLTLNEYLQIRAAMLAS